jgi:alkylation response protein AidB-like acyl-CoA dehydrogenase
MINISGGRAWQARRRQTGASVRLDLTDDEGQLEEAFADFFEREAGPRAAREAEPSGFDPVLWDKLVKTGATEMATASGGDATLTDMTLVAAQAGRWIAPVPLVEHLVATSLLDGRDGSGPVAFAPVPARDGWLRSVPGGGAAREVVGVVADELVLLELAETPPVTPNLASLPLADVEVATGRRTVLAGGAEAAAAFARARARWQILTAAALGGAASAALELGRAYVMQRRQFGVLIGSFQALQHALADLPGAIDGVGLLVAKAAWSVDTQPPPVVDLRHNDIDAASPLAAMAYLFAAQTAQEATKRSLQCHGGYGYSAEYDIQLYYRRVRGWALLAGPPAGLLRELAAELGVAA